MLLWALLGAALAVWAYGLNAVQRWRHRHLPGPRPAWLLGWEALALRSGLHAADRRRQEASLCAAPN
jgi:hypothetical protein